MRIRAGNRTISVWDRYVSGSGLTLTIAALVVLSVTYPIQDARWVKNMAPVTLIGILGLGFATVVAHSSLRPLKAHLSAAALGTAVSFLSAVAMTSGSNIFDRVGNLLQELQFWFEGVPTDEIRGGLVEFAVFLIAISWALGYLAGWLALRRQQGWVAVLMGGTVLSVALGNIAEHGTRWLTLFMVAGILLLIHMATARRMVGWRAKRLSFEPATVLSQSGFILGAGVLIIIGVATIPTPGVSPLGFVGDAFKDSSETAEKHFSRLFNGLPSRQDFRTLTYNSSTHFQGNPNLTDELLFTVSGAEAGYWRARTYTTYTSDGWNSEGAEFGDFEPATEPELERVPRPHGFRISAATATIFTAGLPSEFDQPVEALSFEDAPSDTLHVRTTDGREFFSVRTGLRYTSVGSESLATPAQLREATTDYPEWVTDRYLQLPDTLPRRVRDLAAEIADPEDSAYDQVEAIREYVTALPYNLDIQAPPSGSDGVDYFLFDLRQGYCDYYASSTAVLLRSLGIPSRYVLGYASGNWNSASRFFQVQDLHYHSWVEAYFPEYGWITFEATPPGALEFGGPQSNLSPLGPLAEQEVEDGLDGFSDDGEEEPAPAAPFEQSDGSGLDAGVIAIAVVALLAVASTVFYYNWWLRLARLSRADELYAKMRRLAALLGLPAKPHQTPFEYSTALGREMPGHAADFESIARAYAGRRYADSPIPMTDLRNAEEAWSRVRWMLIFRMFRVKPA